MVSPCLGSFPEGHFHRQTSASEHVHKSVDTEELNSAFVSSN